MRRRGGEEKGEEEEEEGEDDCMIILDTRLDSEAAFHPCWCKRECACRENADGRCWPGRLDSLAVVGWAMWIHSECGVARSSVRQQHYRISWHGRHFSVIGWNSLMGGT